MGNPRLLHLILGPREVDVLAFGTEELHGRLPRKSQIRESSGRNTPLLDPCLLQTIAKLGSSEDRHFATKSWRGALQAAHLMSYGIGDPFETAATANLSRHVAGADRQAGLPAAVHARAAAELGRLVLLEHCRHAARCEDVAHVHQAVQHLCRALDLRRRVCTTIIAGNTVSIADMPCTVVSRDGN